jgi:excisionase family DNA binding protein
MPTKFDDYLREIEEKIKAEGPEAVARWEAFNTHFAMAHDESEISCADGEVEAVAVEADQKRRCSTYSGWRDSSGRTWHRRVSRIRSEARRTILYMLTVAEAADRVGKDPETVRRWIRSGRLRARRVGRRHAISDQDLRVVEDELFPMAELPDEWKIGDDGSPAPNWVAALHRSRRDH